MKSEKGVLSPSASDELAPSVFIKNDAILYFASTV